jgi:protoporphyrinogen oxidase
MDNLTTDWIGARMYRPSLAELLRGALGNSVADVHYVQNFRYPSRGGFESYLEPFAKQFDVRLNHRLIGVDPVTRLLRFANGTVHPYSTVISSIPLPELIPLIDHVPEPVVAAARTLGFTSAVIVNIGVNRADISKTAMTYFYDDDILISRISLPHMFSENNAPPACGAIQAEVYFSEKYKPLCVELPAIVETVVQDLRRCGFIRDDDTILMTDAVMCRYANVIYDLDRAQALGEVHRFLDETGIHYCGRYGNWDHSWTDQAFLSGELTAKRAVESRDITA